MPARLPEGLKASVSLATDYMLNEIDDLRKENAALLAANLDCILHYKDAVAEIERIQQQKPIAYLAAGMHPKPLPREVVRRLLNDAGYEDAIQGRADFINGLRHGELEHGITGLAMREKVE